MVVGQIDVVKVLIDFSLIHRYTVLHKKTDEKKREREIMNNKQPGSSDTK